MEKAGNDRNNKLIVGNILLILQVAAILLIAIALGTYLWSATGLAKLEPALQVVFIASLLLCLSLRDQLSA